jgi:alanine-synthesizing transaminase
MIKASDRTAHLNYAIRNLARVAEERERTGGRVIYLNIGDPQIFGFRPPRHLVESVARAVRDNFTGYTHSAGLLEAREAVASMALSLGAKTRPDDVVITSGASEAAELLLTALLNEGDEILLPAPGYPLYSAIVTKLGAVARYYRLDGARRWQPDIKEVDSLISRRTRALLLINPHNPTGSITSDETTAQLVMLAAGHGLLLIADEVYRELCFTKPPTPSSGYAEAIGAPHVTLESLSKTHLVPGWRVGWMRYTNSSKMRELIAAINRLADARLCAPTPAQYAVRPALEGDREFQRQFLRIVGRRRDLALDYVRETAGLSCNAPDAGFFMMVRAEDTELRTDERFVLDLLAETGVLVVHGSGFGADARDGYFRLVYLADEETLGNAFSEIGKFMLME